MENMDKIMEAIDYATIAHSGQIRKTSGKPKIVHPYGVAMIIYSYGYSEDLVIAGLLHDVVEDCKDYSIQDIARRFGKKVAKYVSDVTEPDKTLDWKTRKLEHVEKIRNVVYGSKVLCAADKIHNLSSLEKDLKSIGETVWDKFNATKEEVCWYYSSMYESIIKGHEKVDIPIFDELKLVVNRVVLGGK